MTGDPRDTPPQPVHEPFDIDAEQAVLGIMLRDQERIPEALAILEDWHFYDPLHQRIFALMASWAMDPDKVINPLTVGAAMKADPGIAEVSRNYIPTLAAAAPVIAKPAAFALIVREHAQRRDALWALDEAKRQLLEGPTLVREALVGVVEVADEAERIASGARYQTAMDAADESIRDAERASAGHPVRAVRTGLVKLDNETGGFQGGDFVVIAGKSGMGKSALMGGISWHAAALHYPTIVFSLEMKRKQWVQRLLTDIDFHLRDDEGSVAYRKFRATGTDANGRTLGLTQEDFARMMFARDHLKEFNPWLEIHDDDGLTIGQIAARARAFQAKWRNDPAIRKAQGIGPDEEPIGLVVVDYIQIMEMPPGKFQRSREQEVASFARGLKGLAKKLDWPVIGGSQLNEDDKGRGKDSKRPQAGDVRESKAIRHEADIMLLPYRMAEALQDARPDASPGEPAWNAWNAELTAARHHFDLVVGKNRMGRKTNLELWADMAASAVRDEQPIRRRAQQEADDMLKGFNL